MQIDDDEEREELMSFVGTRVDFTEPYKEIFAEGRGSRQ